MKHKTRAYPKSLYVFHHNAGFGFTERPKMSLKSQLMKSDSNTKRLNPYSFSTSAGIGTALLCETSKKMNSSTTFDAEQTQNFTSSLEGQNIGLFGHSMGSITTLKMALQIPRSTRKTIILVSPAILYSKQDKLQKKENDSNLWKRSGLASIMGSMKDNLVAKVLRKAFDRVFLIPAQILLYSAMKIVFEIPFQYFLKRLAR